MHSKVIKIKLAIEYVRNDLNYFVNMWVVQDTVLKCHCIVPVKIYRFLLPVHKKVTSGAYIYITILAIFEVTHSELIFNILFVDRIICNCNNLLRTGNKVNGSIDQEEW